MVFIKHGNKKIPFDFNVNAAEKFEEEFDTSYFDAVKTYRIKYWVKIAWYGIEEGYRQQGKDPAVTLEELRGSSLTDESSLLFKVITAQKDAEKK